MTNTVDTIIIDNSNKVLPASQLEVPDVLVWVDLEATGLSETEDVPLELGVVVTDLNLKILHERDWYIREEGWYEKLQKNPLVLDMHTKSGLVDELKTLPEYRRHGSQHLGWGNAQASYLAWKWLTEDLSLPPGEYPVCGSSIFYDRRFMIHQLPAFNGFFHYRNIDISTLKELCKRFNPNLYRALLKQNKETELPVKTHRTLDDLKATLVEAAFYVDHFLFVEMPDEEDFMHQEVLPGL